MKIPLSWLKEFIDFSLTHEELEHRLTMAGLEVDGIEEAALPFKGIIVGKVLETSPHPEADKLTVATVSDGQESFQVVCGAPNCKPGLITAFAKTGARLALDEEKPFKIKKSKLRGVESFGMLCSEAELGLAEESDSIIALPEDSTIGQDLHELFGETILEVSFTPNLGHCWSVLGVARELAAITKQTLHTPEFKLVEAKDLLVDDFAKVQVDNTDDCLRYTCRVIRDLKVGPSPQWLQQRLAHSGIRSINNVVDVTNYVLLEYGHPLHAFDYDKLDAQRIIVRNAKDGEEFQTLDNLKHRLKPHHLLICDASKPVALAGVMGGLNSEVSDQTKHVLLESAYFAPTSVRKTSKELSCQTEASKHFERGSDPHNVVRALNRAASLLHELAEGKVCKGFIDIKQDTFKPKTMTCRYQRINTLIGIQLAVSEVEEIFERLEFQPAFDGKDTFTLTVPTYRNDLYGEVDLIEEIARIYGYDNIKLRPSRYRSSTLPHAPIYLFENRVRERLLAKGLQECISCDLISPTLVDIVADKPIPRDSIVSVLNPTSAEQSILRPSLLPGFLQMLKHNIAHQNHHVSAFEIGRIHLKDGAQYKERSMAAIVMMGQQRQQHWERKPHDVDFFDLKGLLEELTDLFGVQNLQFKKSDNSTLHPGRQASLVVDGQTLGVVGELAPSVLRQFNINKRVIFAELDLHDLHEHSAGTRQMKELNVFPCSERDWTITMDASIPMEKIFSLIEEIPSKLLQKVTLLDIYESEKLGEGLRNITLRFEYRDKKKTVSQESVDAEHKRISEKVSESLGATI